MIHFADATRDARALRSLGDVRIGTVRVVTVVGFSRLPLPADIVRTSGPAPSPAVAG